jgi:DNA polymerase II small subunit/DNA polymerase delta subunit B
MTTLRYWLDDNGYTGYLRINGCSVRVVHATDFDDLVYYANREGYQLDYSSPVEPIGHIVREG